MLVVFNLPLVGIWVKMLTVPYRLLSIAILFFCCIGVYSLNYNVFDIIITAIFGIVGYVWSKLKCEGAPLLLGLVLGPLMEENFRRALLLSRGNFMTFLERPLSASLLGIAALLVIIISLPSLKKKREIFEET
jgi:TctA family transporter